MIKYLSGPSNFWRCPNCQAILEKRAVLDALGASVVGVVTCGNCGRHHSSADVYDGKYDLPEVELNCPHCHVLLRGPQDDLLGYPCPACNRPLPEGNGVTIEELLEQDASADLEVYQRGRDGELKQTTVASALKREKARQEHERAVEIMLQGNYTAALEIFEEVLKTLADDPDPMIYLNIAVCHAHLGEFKQSLAVLEEALRLWPGNARLQQNYEAIKQELR